MVALVKGQNAPLAADRIRNRLNIPCEQLDAQSHPLEFGHSVLGHHDDEVVDALGVDQRCAPLHAMDDVALRQQKLGEIAAVLARDSGNQRNAVGQDLIP